VQLKPWCVLDSALTSWRGAGSSGGVLVATALGLVRSHPLLKPVALPWPQPMALDNHRSLISEMESSPS